MIKKYTILLCAACTLLSSTLLQSHRRGYRGYKHRRYYPRHRYIGFGGPFYGPHPYYYNGPYYYGRGAGPFITAGIVL